MKKLIVLMSAGLALFTSLAYAGATNSVSVVVNVNDDGSGDASGDMLTARTSANEFELIGCGIKGYKTGPSLFGFCQAADSGDNYVVCTTSKPHLLEVMKATGDYSFIRFEFDKKGECTRLDFSTQSFYLPSNVTGN